MNRITSLLALSAIVLAGAFAGTAAQASASNVTVAFNVHNADPSASMIQVSASSNISSLTAPPAAILPGNYDPATGSALFSAPAPVNVGDHVDGYVKYEDANTFGSPCTFNLQIKRLGLNSFSAHFSISESGTNCTVPSDPANNSNGVFTSTTYTFGWKT